VQPALTARGKERLKQKGGLLGEYSGGHIDAVV